MKELNTKEKNYLLNLIRNIKDFPKPDIIFKDITTLLNDKLGFKFLLDHLEDRYKDLNLDFIIGIESRGFIFGGALCARLNTGFVPVRKPNKLPYITISQKYSLEYGFDEVQMHIDAFKLVKRPKVLLIDDLIATGGTAQASVELLKQLNVDIIEACFLIDLVELGGSKKIARECKVYSILEA